jgi:long-chain acyl-CoA synthetase
MPLVHEGHSMEGLNASNLADMFWKRVQASGGDVAFRVREPSGNFSPRTWAWMGEEVSRLSEAWVAAGLQEEDRVALLAPSTIDWILTEWSIASAGGVTVPLFSSLRADETAGYLVEAGVRWAIVDSAERAEELRGLVEARTSQVPRFIVLSEALAALAAGERPTGHEAKAAARRSRIDAARVATVACTSGTTGRPKGVMLTHANYLALLRALPQVGILHDDLRKTGLLLFLPFPHSFARLILLASCMYGIPVALSDPKTLREDAKLLQPGLIPSVPLVYQRMYEGTMSALRSAPASRRRLGERALAIGSLAARHLERSGKVPLWLRPLHAAAERLVLRKIRAALGLSRIHALLSGSAVLPPQVQDFFAALGVPLLEGYGSTETSGVLTCNPLGRARRGTVGKPLDGVTLRIADDGEILARGDMIAWQYTDSRPIRGEGGWFGTGDAGHIGPDGYLVLTGRKQDLIKTLQGQRVIPYPIELRLEGHAAIDFAVLVGDGRSFLSALLCPAQGVHVTDELRQEVAAWISQVNSALAPHEQIRRHIVLTEPLNVQNGLMTASLKVRRNAVCARYAALIDEFYQREKS